MNKKIKSYYWEGINFQGTDFTGIMEVNSISALKQELSRQGILLRKIRKANHFYGSKIKQSNIYFFFRQLVTMLKAGVTLTHSLEIISNAQKNLSMQSMIRHIKKDLESGHLFSVALQKHPKHFDRFVCNLIACGERSGKLEWVLTQILSYKENMATIEQKLKKALSYPLFVLFIAFFISMALLLFVVPEFQSLFLNFGAELPWLTKTIINLTFLLRSYWFIFFIFFSLMIFAFIQIRVHIPRFRYACDKLILKLPILGSMLIQTMIARFAKTLGICFEAGLPIIEALDAIKNLSKNQVYLSAINRVSREVLSGRPMHFAIAKILLCPPLALEMIKIGEESGTLEFMLNKLGSFYEEEVNHNLSVLLNLLEPVIMVILALIIGSLVIAMYLPIFQLSLVV